MPIHATGVKVSPRVATCQRNPRKKTEDLVTLPRHAIVRGTRVFVALRKAGRASQGATPVHHAVTPHCRPALCAGEPGAGSGWAEPPGADVTCPACLRRLQRLR